MEYVVRIIEALTWPATVLAIVWVFRSQLAKLCARITTLKYGDFEASFEREIRELAGRRVIESLPEQMARTEPETDFKRLARLASISPRAAITEAWIEVEKEGDRVAEILDLDTRRKPALPQVIRRLIQQRIFSESASEVFDRARRLRNRAAHAPEFSLEQNEAESYIDLCLHLAHELWNAGNALEFMQGLS